MLSGVDYLIHDQFAGWIVNMLRTCDECFHVLTMFMYLYNHSDYMFVTNFSRSIMSINT